MELKAYYEEHKLGRFLLIEGEINHDFLQKHLLKPCPYLFVASDDTGIEEEYRGKVRYPVGSRSNFLDLFLDIKKRLKAEGYNLSLPRLSFWDEDKS